MAGIIGLPGGLVIGGPVNTVVGAPDTASGLACQVQRVGNNFTLEFTFTEFEVALTDAAGDGSYGTAELFTFIEGAIDIENVRAELSVVEDGTVSGAGDGAYAVGVGHEAIAAAADGALANDEDSIFVESATASDGTATVEHVGEPSSMPLDGTSDAIVLSLNVSGSADTIDASGVLTITGSMTINGQLLGDI